MKNRQNYDLKRCIQFCGVGMLFSGPFMHYQYSKVLPYLVPSKSKYLAFKKLAIDQTFGATIMVSGVLLSLNAMKGRTVH